MRIIWIFCFVYKTLMSTVWKKSHNDVHRTRNKPKHSSYLRHLLSKEKKKGFEGPSKVIEYSSILSFRCCICFDKVSASFSWLPYHWIKLLVKYYWTAFVESSAFKVVLVIGHQRMIFRHKSKYWGLYYRFSVI